MNFAAALRRRDGRYQGPDDRVARGFMGRFGGNGKERGIGAILP